MKQKSTAASQSYITDCCEIPNWEKTPGFIE